jgi:type IV secretion system protein VirB4
LSTSVSALHAILPWNFITRFHEGVVIQKDGLFQRTFVYRAPDAASLSALEIDTLSIRLNDFAKRLGAGWAIFIEAQRFSLQEYPSDLRFSSAFDTLASYLIEREREESFTARGRHFDSSYYITVAWRPPVESVKKLTAMFIQSGKNDSTKTIRENVEFFVNETNSVIGLLANNIRIAPLNNAQTLAYLHSALSFNRHPIRFPHTQILLDRILPDSELINDLTMKLGEYYIPIIGINDFPDETYPAIFEPLNRSGIEYRWVTRFLCLDKEEAKKEVQKKEKAHRGARKTFLQVFAESTSGPAGAGSAVYNHGAGVKEEDSINAGVEIETDVASLGYYTSCIMVWDKNLRIAEKKAEYIRNIINSTGFTCKIENFNALEAWKSMMPGQVYANYRALPVMSYNFSHIVPLSSVWAGLRHNEHAGRISGVDLPHITCSTLEGTPFYLNLNPGGDVGHAAIWGPTGAGKSTLLNLLEAQFFRYPDSQVIVFDKGRSCRQICLACGGLFFEPASDNIAGISFQPLRDLETDRDLADASDFIESLFQVNNYEVKPAMRAAIKETLERMKGIPEEARTITSFLQYCNYIDPVQKKNIFTEQMGDYRYYGGKFGKIFDSSFSGLSLDTRFLAIEMEALMNRGEGCVVPALVYLFNMVDKKIDSQAGSRLTLLVLDEAWLFLKNETFSEKIAEWLKVLRKKNVFVVFATQDVADVEKSPLKTTIVQQCLTKIYLADPSALTNAMKTVYLAFGLTETEIAFIQQAEMKRDYFYTSPLGRRMFQLDLGKLTLSLIGAPRHELLDKLVTEKGPGIPLCKDILAASRIDYQRLLRHDAPEDKVEDSQAQALKPARLPISVPPEIPRQEIPDNRHAAHTVTSSSSSVLGFVEASIIFDAITAEIPNLERRKKGGGRAADILAKKLGVSPSTVYQALAIVKAGDPELINMVKEGKIGFKKAYKSLKEPKKEGVI